MRGASRRTIILLVIAAVVVLGAAATGVTLLLSHQHAQNVRAFKAQTSSDWGEMAGSARTVTASLLRVTSPAELAEVSTEAGKMKEKVDGLVARLEKKSPPSGYSQVRAKELGALRSTSAYLHTMSDLAGKASADEVAAAGQLLADQGRKAQGDVSDFLSAASWLRGTLPGDLYNGSGVLLQAFQPQRGMDVQRQQVYEALQTFMTADIFQHNFDVIWSMLDSRLHTGLDYYKVTKEKLASVWAKNWDGKPVDFYVSKSRIDFQSPSSATAKVIAYMKNQSPRIEEISLVNEGGVWKIDSDPFAGF